MISHLVHKSTFLRVFGQKNFLFYSECGLGVIMALEKVEANNKCVMILIFVLIISYFLFYFKACFLVFFSVLLPLGFPSMLITCPDSLP